MRQQAKISSRWYLTSLFLTIESTLRCAAFLLPLANAVAFAAESQPKPHPAAHFVAPTAAQARLTHTMATRTNGLSGQHELSGAPNPGAETDPIMQREANRGLALRIHEVANESTLTLAAIVGALPHVRWPRVDVKDLDEVHRKMARRGYSSAAEITDHLRGRMAFRDLDALYEAVARLDELSQAQVSAQQTPAAAQLDVADFVVVRVEDRFVKPLRDRYAEVKVNLRLSNGLIAELQFHLEGLLRAKCVDDFAYAGERNKRAELRASDDRQPTSEETRALDHFGHVGPYIFGQAMVQYGLHRPDADWQRFNQDTAQDDGTLVRAKLPPDLKTKSGVVKTVFETAAFETPQQLGDSLGTMLDRAGFTEQPMLQLARAHTTFARAAGVLRQDSTVAAAKLKTLTELGGYSGNLGAMTDLLRGYLRFSTPDALYMTLEDLVRTYGPQLDGGSTGPRIVGFTDLINSPLVGRGRKSISADREVQLLFEFPEQGHIATLSLQLESVEWAKRVLCPEIDSTCRLLAEQLAFPRQMQDEAIRQRLEDQLRAALKAQEWALEGMLHLDFAYHELGTVSAQMRWPEPRMPQDQILAFLERED